MKEKKRKKKRKKEKIKSYHRKYYIKSRWENIWKDEKNLQKIKDMKNLKGIKNKIIPYIILFLISFQASNYNFFIIFN